MELHVENITSLKKSSRNQVPHTPSVNVSKTFSAPVEKVFNAFTEPRYLKKWWGPEEFTCPLAVTNFKVGGKYLLEMKSEEMDLFSTGVYEEIYPHRLIGYTDQFSDNRGNILTAKEAGMGETWEGHDLCYVTVRFRPLGKMQTEVQLSHEGIPASEHDNCVHGWTSAFKKLKTLVEIQ